MENIPFWLFSKEVDLLEAEQDFSQLFTMRTWRSLWR
jgi:hypothetical protein